MADLVERQAAIDALRMDISIIPYAKAREYVRAAIETIYNRLEELPSAQPERKSGRWIPKFDGQFKGGAYWFCCSECERVVPDVRNGGWSFCPQCGAKMEAENDGRHD